jgi:hypothetical protein
MSGSRAVQMCREQEQRIAELTATLTAMAWQLAQTEATRDRYQKNGKRLLAHMRELESIFGFPGVMRSLEKALHPDTGAGGDAAARTAMFQTLMAVRNRIAREQ